MTKREMEQRPFDERVALGELERFRADIERCRQERQTVSDDFEEFVRAFPSPVDLFPSELPEGELPEGRDSGVPGSGEAVRPAVSAPAIAPVARVPVPADGAVAAPTPAAVEGTETPTRTSTPLLAITAVGLVAGALALWAFQHSGSEEDTAAPTVTEQTTQPAASAGAAPPSPIQATAGASAPAESELTTTRPAWVRLIADGQRVFERELPAGTRIPFKAERTIVIRTGDAGAVRLSIGGDDRGVLGRDGEVVTRSFTVPSPPR